jgi:hypothetical protein
MRLQAGGGAGEMEGERGGGGGVLEVHLCPFASGKIVPVTSYKFCIEKEEKLGCRLG